MSKIDLSLLTTPVNDINVMPHTTFFNRTIEGKNPSLSLNGEWSFIYLEKFDNKYLKEVDLSKLDTIKVPSHFELQGYGKIQYVNKINPFNAIEDLKLCETPNKNPCGIYFKDIYISSLINDYILEINGFNEALYLYVNNKFVGFSQNGFITNRFLLNDFIKEGNNRLTIIVFNYSASTWLTIQDMWRFHGICRDVNLLTLPKDHLDDIKVLALPDEDFKNGKLKVSFNVLSKGNATLTLLDKNNKKVFEKKENVDKTYIGEFDIKNVDLWSDEIPNLYTLKIKYNEEDVSLNVGFRKVEIKEGIMLLNGKRIVLRGVNRHEFDCHTGRYIKPELVENDIILLKQNNFNAIRCSHYPNINEFYDLCDKYGILVCDETPIESHATWGTGEGYQGKINPMDVIPGSNPLYKDFTVDRGLSMLRRDYNHPSIIMWSIGNESYFGENLLALANKIREEDPTRIVHYEGNSLCYPKYLEMSDVISRMYTHADQIEKFLKKHKDKPFILCEFEHSMGNSTGNFDEYMALTYKYPHYQGGFIWDYVDQGLLIDGEMRYGGEFGDYPNDSNFCADGILLSDRTPTGKLANVKHYYSPIDVVASLSKIEVESRYNFKDTSNLVFKYELFKDNKVVDSFNFKLDIKPLSKAVFNLENKVSIEEDSFYFIRVTVYEKNKTLYSEKMHEIYFRDTPVNKPFKKNVTEYKHENKGGLKVFYSTEHITVQKDDFKVIFDGRNVPDGGLQAIIKHDDIYFKDISLPTLYRATTDNDRTGSKYFHSFYLGGSRYPIYIPFFGGVHVVKQTDDMVAVELTFRMFVGIAIKNIKIRYEIYSDETIKVSYSFKKCAIIKAPPLIGMKFFFDKNAIKYNYIGLGPYDSYIDRYKGLKYGHYEDTSINSLVPYSSPQECGSRMYTKEVEIEINERQKIKFIALNEAFSFKYQPYDEFELDNAQYHSDLPLSKRNVLTIEAFNKGVGGDDSWGSPTHSQYLLKKKKVKQEFLIKITK